MNKHNNANLHKTEEIDRTKIEGYSLRIGAFYSWLKKSGYTTKQIAKRIGMDEDELKRNTPTEPENPDEPTNPDEPSEPTEPEQPDDSTDTDNTDNTDNNGQSKKKIPASVILLPILLVLGIGGLVTYIVIKKKKTGKNKKSEQKENE